MAPISESLRNSLDALSIQLDAAESLLCKLPGVELASVEVPGEDGYFLEVIREADRSVQICLQHYDSAGEEAIASTPLKSLPITDRIELSQYIPELLDRVVNAQDQVAALAEEAAAVIEQALANVSKGENAPRVAKTSKRNKFRAEEGGKNEVKGNRSKKQELEAAKPSALESSRKHKSFRLSKQQSK